MIEGDCVDDIFLEDFFVGAFVAEELGEFVMGGFGGDTFLHLFFDFFYRNITIIGIF